MADNMHEVVNETLDTIEDTLDILERNTSSWLANRWTIATLSGALGLAIGGSVTYWLVAKKLEKKYQAIADEEIADVKEHYSILRKEGPNGDLEALASKYEDETPQATDPAEIAKNQKILESGRYLPYDAIPPTETDQMAARESIAKVQEEIEPEQVGVVVEAEITQVKKSIFTSSDPNTYWDPEEEEQRRALEPDKPYVITVQEFNTNEDDYNQISLVYYDGDGVLVDEDEDPINDEDNVVGHQNLLRFGHASQDRNVVYVCNNRLSTFFEVVRNDAKYSEHVLGLRHSDRPALRRFRNYDE